MSLKFSSLSPATWGTLVACIIVGVIIFFVSRSKKSWNTRMLSNAALCIALSFILSCIRLYRLPQGGSITLASMLPLFLFAYVYGVGPGLLVGAGYGFLNLIQDAYFVHPVEMILDYPLAYALLGLCGLAPKLSRQGGMIPGILLGVCGRFLCAFLSGIIFFGTYAPEGQNVFVYSAIYNGFYLIPETAICIIISLIPQIQSLARRMALTELKGR